MHFEIGYHKLIDPDITPQIGFELVLQIAEAVRNRITAVGTQTAYIEPGSPWENGYVEIFNARFRNELLNGEIFYSPKEVHIVIEQLGHRYNTRQPYSSLGYRPPAPEAIIPLQQGRP